MRWRRGGEEERRRGEESRTSVILCPPQRPTYPHSHIMPPFRNRCKHRSQMLGRQFLLWYFSGMYWNKESILGDEGKGKRGKKKRRKIYILANFVFTAQPIRYRRRSFCFCTAVDTNFTAEFVWCSGRDGGSAGSCSLQLSLKNGAAWLVYCTEGTKLCWLLASTGVRIRCLCAI